MNGTYVREPDGATLLFYSPEFWNDPTYALRSNARRFRIISPESPEWIEDAGYLTPGEWLAVDGPLMEVGGAMGPMGDGSA